MVDANKRLDLFIYPFRTGDLLQLSQRKLSDSTRRDILRSALCGLADMHDRQVVHNESWARSIQNWQSDVYSFGVVMVYVLLNRMIFRGLLKHIGEQNPFYDRLVHLAGDFSEEDPRQPFELLFSTDRDLSHLIRQMTSMDPARRIRAREALEHPWWTHGRVHIHDVDAIEAEIEQRSQTNNWPI
ncbi:hypothetical protein N656DRAFT_844176 [Canariomyces notabilis]|uniref:Protein kinase domain-containing protein n=1 Tax=Canariomyces notabilis TaxID=2074819 RepID=A0AAN6YTX1_9PEZI|nr:hypothetical protein N656DRAFT_844176 [Canariomyces arenarius]